MNKVSLCGTRIPYEDADELFYELFDGMSEEQAIEALDKFILCKKLHKFSREQL